MALPTISWHIARRFDCCKTNAVGQLLHRTSYPFTLVTLCTPLSRTDEAIPYDKFVSFKQISMHPCCLSVTKYLFYLLSLYFLSSFKIIIIQSQVHFYLNNKIEQINLMFRSILIFEYIRIFRKYEICCITLVY